MVSPSIRSPAVETANPFTKLTRFAEDAATPRAALDVLIPSPTTTGRRHQTTHAEGQPVARIQRRKSRSMSRRPSASSPTVGTRELDEEHWHFEPSTTCNGGLRNAIDSVGERMRKKVWVGTLGTPTDSFKEDLRKEVDQRLLSQRDSVSVWIPDNEFQRCYDEFCHQVCSTPSPRYSHLIVYRFYGPASITLCQMHPRPRCSTSLPPTSSIKP
jgi:trehalose 6-phosphate synthase complex regulatory subunit